MSSCEPSRTLPVKAIREDEHTSSSSSGTEKKIGGSLFKRQNMNKNEKTSITVAPPMKKQQTFDHRSEQRASFCCLCVKSENQPEEWPVAPLQVRRCIFQQIENNNGNNFQKIDW